MILSEEEINEAIGKEWGADLSKHPLPDRVKRMCNVVVKAYSKKVFEIIDKMYNSPYEHMALAYLHQALSEEAKE